MFGFFRKKKTKESSEATARTFIEATGGGWGEVPDVVPGDGGVYADYVARLLEAARKQALGDSVEVGRTFKFVITDIPVGIGHPIEISLGVMARAGDYGLRWEGNVNETFTFRRVS